jgi:hypothetical protein
LDTGNFAFNHFPKCDKYQSKNADLNKFDELWILTAIRALISEVKKRTSVKGISGKRTAAGF